MSLFFEIQYAPHPGLYAYKKGSAGRGLGYGAYLGPAQRASEGRPLGEAHLFRDFEIVWLKEDEALRLLEFRSSLQLIEDAVRMYLDKPSEAWHLRNIREMQRDWIHRR
jgi:hypothetical protein